MTKTNIITKALDFEFGSRLEDTTCRNNIQTNKNTEACYLSIYC